MDDFRALRGTYLSVLRKLTVGRQGSNSSLRLAYEATCGWLVNPLLERPRVDSVHSWSLASENKAVQELAQRISTTYGHQPLQALASLLGMLMHLELDHREQLKNHRRPGKQFSTYPTSPAVTRLVAEAVLRHLLKIPIPQACLRSLDAERYADRALNFRILDPSMESGQFLIEVALGVVRRIHRTHAPRSRAAHLLTRAMLDRLSRDCLWGVDRNELATTTISSLFSRLSSDLKIPPCVPQHLVTADALRVVSTFPSFHAVLNNPPWGETLAARDQNRLRQRFKTLHHWFDTYVAFSELAVDVLRPGGFFALILPSHVVAARNTALTRKMLVEQTLLEQMILLPRPAFATASVRGLILFGRRKPVPRPRRCRVTIFPIVKRFDHAEPPRSFEVQRTSLADLNGRSWWPLFEIATPTVHSRGSVPLQRLARISGGVKVYGRGQGKPPQTRALIRARPYTVDRPMLGTVPAVRGRDVREYVVEAPSEFVRFGPWLARVSDHDVLRHSPRVFARELCRRDGKLTAAIARDDAIPLHGVLTLVPHGIDPLALVAILNSRYMAMHVRSRAASFSKVDFQKITIAELRELPVPLEAIEPADRARLGFGTVTKKGSALRGQLLDLARRLSDMGSTDGVLGVRLRRQVDEVTAAMYGTR